MAWTAPDGTHGAGHSDNPDELGPRPVLDRLAGYNHDEHDTAPFDVAAFLDHLRAGTATEDQIRDVVNIERNLRRINDILDALDHNPTVPEYHVVLDFATGHVHDSRTDDDYDVNAATFDELFYGYHDDIALD